MEIFSLCQILPVSMAYSILHIMQFRQTLSTYNVDKILSRNCSHSTKKGKLMVINRIIFVVYNWFPIEQNYVSHV